MTFQLPKNKLGTIVKQSSCPNSRKKARQGLLCHLYMEAYIISENNNVSKLSFTSSRNFFCCIKTKKIPWKTMLCVFNVITVQCQNKTNYMSVIKNYLGQSVPYQHKFTHNQTDTSCNFALSNQCIILLLRRESTANNVTS